MGLIRLMAVVGIVVGLVVIYLIWTSHLPGVQNGA